MSRRRPTWEYMLARESYREAFDRIDDREPEGPPHARSPREEAEIDNERDDLELARDEGH